MLLGKEVDEFHCSQGEDHSENDIGGLGEAIGARDGRVVAAETTSDDEEYDRDEEYDSDDLEKLSSA